jgi:predicted O-methyltransferase YrrM
VKKEESMKLSDLEPQIAALHATTAAAGAQLYQFVLDHPIHDIVEVGTYHGKSACYMAAALQEKGRGCVTSLDLPISQTLKPNAETLAQSFGLADYVKPLRAAFGSHWLLRQMIIDSTVDGVCAPRFDFAFIDGYHSWEQAGLDFFLIDKLLRPGGWILFDDMHWSFRTSRSWSQKSESLPDDYREARHVRDVFNLLVRQHPGYENLRDERRWGWARKVGPA